MMPRREFSYFSSSQDNDFAYFTIELEKQTCFCVLSPLLLAATSAALQCWDGQVYTSSDMYQQHFLCNVHIYIFLYIYFFMKKYTLK